MSGNTVLITGGATGLGFALAEAFSKLDNKVIICGRRGDRLIEAKGRLPGIETMRCDISNEDDSKALFEWVGSEFSEMNVLVNNAGIQRPINLKMGVDELLKGDDEIEINLKSQIYLAARFIPLLSEREEAAIINVSSGLGFVPLAAFPIYCATKAAIHSFSISLRYQLSDTKIRVFEVIPPTLHDTELKGKPIEKADWSISASEMAGAVMEGLKRDEYEIAAGSSKGWINSSWRDLGKIFKNINH